MTQTLIKLDKARRMLAEAKTLDDFVHIRDMAQAAREYAKAAKLGLESANHATDVKIHAEIEVGKLLAVMDKAPGQLRRGCSLQPRDEAPTYAELGIEKTAAHRWQTMATLPEQRVEQYIADTIDKGDELTSAAVYKLAQREKQRQEREAMKENVANMTIDATPYKTIVIDPPWPVQKILRDERPMQDLFDYPTMTVDEIEGLPIKSLADGDGCHLYLWVTHKYLPKGLQFVHSWGFCYQCLLTWLKPTGMTPFSWMYNTEHVIFARCGTLPIQEMGLKLGFEAPVVGHSVKPDIFYDHVVRASPSPRLELFARKQREGFKVWGNEV